MLCSLSTACPALAASQNVSMIFEFADECDDGFTPEIEFYLKGNPEKFWGTYWLQYFNKPLKTKITCEEDSQICFGAWLDGSSWGCGKKCTEVSKGACFPCKQTVVSIGLQCSR
jgi:hypothetical protein